MLLEGKTAVVYGAAGGVGAGVAVAFAREGAFVHLTGHHPDALARAAEAIRSSGGQADVAEVDALDASAVEADLDHVVATRGGVDVSFNAISSGQAMGVHLVDVSPGDFSDSVGRLLETNFITMTGAARRMVTRGSGVLLAITATVARTGGPQTGTFSVAGASIEGLCRQLAIDLGTTGVRVGCLRSAGSPDTPGLNETFDFLAGERGLSRAAFEDELAQTTVFKRLPLIGEVANAAVFLASDYGSALTGATLNVNCGEYLD